MNVVSDLINIVINMNNDDKHLKNLTAEVHREKTSRIRREFNDPSTPATPFSVVISTLTE